MATEEAWYEIVAGVLKQQKVDLVTYVPDNVLRPLIDLVHADPFFTAFAVAREEEGLGINAGAWLGGRRGILLMQTSGFATLPNALASLSVPFQIPSLLIENHTLSRVEDVAFIMDRSITQAFATQAPCCFILSPLLTGGKVFAK